MKIFDTRLGAWAMNLALLVSLFAPVVSAQTNVSPVVIAQSPSSLTPTSMVVFATIYPNGRPTSGWFIWGNSTNYGQATVPQAIGVYGTGFYQTITGLSTGVTYYYRAVASNDQGQVVFGEEQHWLLGTPGAATYYVDKLTPTSARLDGLGYPYGLPTSGWFEWGPTPAFGHVTPTTFLGDNSNGSSLWIGNNYLYGLQSSTTFYYRTVVANSVAVAYGATQSFVTPDSNICASSISPMNVNHGYGATMGYLRVGAPANCSWNVVNTNSWITILSGASGMGSSQAVYAVEANTDVLPRSGNIKIAGWNCAVSQAGHYDVSKPADQTVALGGTATFSVTANGTPPFTYQWQFNGVDLVDGGSISGATTSTLVLTGVQYSQAGHYRVIVKDADSTTPSSSATLTVAPTSNALPLAEALDTGDVFFWKTWSDSPGIWFGQTSTSHDGIDALECGGLAPGSYASLEAKSGGPGILSFWWKTAFATPSDRLKFWIGSAQAAAVTNTTDWEQRTFTVPPGDVNLRWTFSNSSTGDQSRAWVDQVQFSPCNFSLWSGGVNVGGIGINSLAYTGTVTLTAAADCPWNVVNTNSWITILSSVTNHGSSSVVYAVAANHAGVYRSGYLAIADQRYSISQWYNSSTNAGISLAQALDTEGSLEWSTIGTPEWFGQTILSRDGIDAAQSGPVGDSAAVTATTTVNGPGMVLFWWKVSSETNKDYLKFFINGVQQTRISGETDWQLLSYNLFSGSNMLKWTYSKNNDVAVGQDRGWLDQVQFIPGSEMTNCVVAVSPISATHSGRNSETGSVYVIAAAGCGWDVVNTNSWITYIASPGESNGLVRYTVSTNNSVNPRIGVILIGGRPFTVTQSGGPPPCSYFIWLTSSTYSFSPASGTITITTQSGCAWNVINTNAWISINSATNGTGAGTVSYQVQENSSSSSRSGYLIVAGQSFLITQYGKPCSYSTSPFSGSHPSYASTGTVAVSTAGDCYWTTLNTNDWITILSGGSGTGYGVITYAVAANNTGSSRSSYFLIGAQPGVMAPYTGYWIVQPAATCNVTLASTNRTLDSAAATNTVTVTAFGGCAWSVFNTNSWISIISGTNVTGNGIVTYAVAANLTASVRSGNIRITDQVFLVSQSGGTDLPPTCTYSLSPGSRTHGYSSATGTVAVTTQNGCAWNVVKTNTWISILSSLNNSNSGTVIYSLSPNTNAQSRAGNVAIGGQLFRLTQSGTGTNGPRLQFMSRTGTNATLSVQGEQGKMYVVECSPDLINWIPISTNAAPSTVTDAAVGNLPRRFYRAVEFP